MTALVSPSFIKAVADDAATAFRLAFDRSEVHDAAFWLARCQQDLAQLWRADALWGITEVVETKSGRALHIVALAGRFDERLVEQMEAWGRSVGCSKSYFTGRRGWVRKMPDYHLRTVTLEKEI